MISLLAQGNANEIANAKPKIGRAEKQTMVALFEMLKKKLEDADSSDDEVAGPATPAVNDDAANAIISPNTTPSNHANTEQAKHDDDAEMLM